MSHMSVCELFQCFWWAFGGIAPLAFLFGAGNANDDFDKGSGILIGLLLQVAIIVCAFKAGGK